MGSVLENTMILGAPRSGKTTLAIELMHKMSPDLWFMFTTTLSGAARLQRAFPRAVVFSMFHVPNPETLLQACLDLCRELRIRQQQFTAYFLLDGCPDDAWKIFGNALSELVMTGCHYNSGAILTANFIQSIEPASRANIDVFLCLRQKSWVEAHLFLRRWRFTHPTDPALDFLVTKTERLGEGVKYSRSSSDCAFQFSPSPEADPDCDPKGIVLRKGLLEMIRLDAPNFDPDAVSQLLEASR